MAEVKYYLDENIAKSVLKGLRLRGINAVSVTDVGIPPHAEPVVAEQPHQQNPPYQKAFQQSYQQAPHQSQTQSNDAPPP